MHFKLNNIAINKRERKKRPCLIHSQKFYPFKRVSFKFAFGYNYYQLQKDNKCLFPSPSSIDTFISFKFTAQTWYLDLLHPRRNPKIAIWKTLKIKTEKGHIRLRNKRMDDACHHDPNLKHDPHQRVRSVTGAIYHGIPYKCFEIGDKVEIWGWDWSHAQTIGRLWRMVDLL